MMTIITMLQTVQTISDSESDDLVDVGDVSSFFARCFPFYFIFANEIQILKEKN